MRRLRVSRGIVAAQEHVEEYIRRYEANIVELTKKRDWHREKAGEINSQIHPLDTKIKIVRYRFNPSPESFEKDQEQRRQENRERMRSLQNHFSRPEWAGIFRRLEESSGRSFRLPEMTQEDWERFLAEDEKINRYIHYYIKSDPQTRVVTVRDDYYEN